MSDIIQIGISALMAYQSALKVSSQNIANADTPFYCRRQIDFSENVLNSGVRVADVRRIVDETTNRYVQMKTSDFSKWDVYFQQLSRFEPLFYDSDENMTSVGKFITDSLSALHEIENNLNPSNRTLLLSRLSALTQQLKSMDGEINRQIQNVNLSLQTEVDQANQIIEKINNINKQIGELGGANQSELFDQREALLQNLAKYFNFTTLTEKDGLIDICLSNGLSLLAGNSPSKLTTIVDPNNPENLLIAVDSGGTQTSINDLIQGGEIKGWIDYRQEGLTHAKSSLGRIALLMAEKFNAQNHLGIDANSNLGGNIFADINSASAITERVIANINNSGTSAMTVSINDGSQLTTSDYQLTIGASDTYVLTRISDNAVVATGSLTTLPHQIDADGFTIDVASGTFTVGDKYTISPVKSAANNFTLAITDPLQLALGWPVNGSEKVKQPGSNGTILVTDITNTENSAFSNPKELNPPIEIRFTVTGGVVQYTLFNATTNTAIEGPITYDPANGAKIFPTPGNYDPGYRVSISGNNIQDGDIFSLTYNTNNTNDNRNAQALARLYQNGTVLSTNGKLVTFNQGYDLLASDISIKTNAARTGHDTLLQVKTQAELNRDAISGVSLEEEMLSLSNYQLAYQASAQVLDVARSIFDILSSVGRR